MARNCLHSRSLTRVGFWFLGIIIFLISTQAKCQQEELIRVKTSPRKGSSRNFPQDKRFRFSNFQRGHIYTANKKEWPIKSLNYDFYLGSMLTIEKGDTLLINNLPEFKYIEVNGIAFIHHKGYYEVLQETNSIKLCVRELYTVKRRERYLNNGYGSFNDPTAGSRIASNPNVDVLFHKQQFYSMVDTADTFYKVNKSNFLKLFPNHRDAIETFFHSHYANSDRREDLIRLFQLCSALNN